MNADARIERSLTIESGFKKYHDALWSIKVSIHCYQARLEAESECRQYRQQMWSPNNVKALLNELDELINQADLK